MPPLWVWMVCGVLYLFVILAGLVPLIFSGNISEFEQRNEMDV